MSNASNRTHSLFSCEFFLRMCRVLKGVREEDNVRMLMTLHAANSEEIHMDISTVVYEQLYETVTQTKLADAPSDMVHSFPRLFRKYASRRYNGKEVSSSAILSLSGLTTQRPISVSVSGVA